jgi:hypothetical protein
LQPKNSKECIMKHVLPIAIIILIQLVPIVALSQSDALNQLQQIMTTNKTHELEALNNMPVQVQYNTLRNDSIRF